MRAHVVGSIVFACFLACTASSPRQEEGDDSDVTDTDGGDAGTDDDVAALPDVQAGLYVVSKVGSLTLPLDAPGGTLAQMIAPTYIRGVSLSFNWADLEPTQGTYAPVLIDAIAAVRALTAATGKSLTVKVHLRNGLPPAWLIPSDAGIGSDITVFTTTLGFRALGQKLGKGSKVDVTFVPTEAGYVEHIRANIVEFARQLDVADPDGTFVRIVQVAGPSSESGGTMRLTPREPFPRVGTDTLGFGWTFQAHLDEWKAMGPLMAQYPAYQKREWTFDLTHEPPNGDDQFGLSTADQMSVVAALVAAHPNGDKGIRLMNEGASAQNNAPAFPVDPNKCDWSADSFDDPANLPESAIAAWPRHEFQAQVANDDPNNFPRFELARHVLFADPKSVTPTTLQHTTFVEIHDDQVLGDGEPLRDQTAAIPWFTCFDAMIRAYAPADAVLSSSAQAFWASVPSPSVSACGPYPPTPASTVCAP